MRLKPIFNILIVLGASIIFLLLWFIGLDKLYAEALRIGTNLFLSPWSDFYIDMDQSARFPKFIAHALINGRAGSYDQDGKIILLPVLMILTWQVLMFFNLPLDKAVRSSIENIITFYLLQVLFLIFLTQYYNSGVIAFIYNMLIGNFYILALFLIIKDTLRFRLLKLPGK